MKSLKHLLVLSLLLVSSFFISKTVFADNSAPVLDSSRTPSFSTISEDPGAPTGSVGTPVSSLVDFTVPAGQVDNVTDVDGGSLGIAITAANTNFTCYYSLNNGASWSVIGAVSSASARLLASDSNHRLYCQPITNFNTAVSDLITFRAWDQTTGVDGSMTDTSTSGGTTAFSSATDTATLTIIAVNDAPEATNLSTAESYVLNIARNLTDIVISDVDSSNVAATLTLSDSAAGTLSTATSGAVTSTYNAGTGVWAATGAIASVNTLLAGVTYTPTPDYSSDFTIATSVTDGVATAITGSKVVTYSTNAAPVAVDDAYTIDEDTASALSVMVNDTDADNDTLVVSAVTTPNHGAAVITNGGTKVSYTPDADFNGIDIFDYTVSDGNGGTNTATVRLTVAPINDAPNAVDDSYTILENSSTTGLYVVNNDFDVDGDILSLVFVDSPDHGGSASIQGDAILYTPDTDFFGTETFSYTISDSSGGTDSATISMDVNSTDVTAPDTFITSDTLEFTTAPISGFLFESTEDPSTFECSLDSGEFAPCTSPYMTSSLALGPHTFEVRAIDGSSLVDESPATVSWTVIANYTLESISPVDGAKGVNTHTPIVFRFADPVHSFLRDHIHISSGPCDTSCPTLDGVWSENNTVLTYTKTDGPFKQRTLHTIRLGDNSDGVLDLDVYNGSFTTRSSTLIGSYTTEKEKSVPEKFHLLRTLKFGMTGDDVKNLQMYLNANGFTVTQPGQETKRFGPKTRAAVIQFQKAHQLVSDGIVGPNTAKAMGWSF